ncbi:hypothetical protein ABTJ17_19940, partial [Acinetobacter baumannii]
PEAEATARDGLKYGQGAPLDLPADEGKGDASEEEPTCPLDGRTGGGLVMGNPRYKIERGQIWAAKVEGRGEGQSVAY